MITDVDTVRLAVRGDQPEPLFALGPQQIGLFEGYGGLSMAVEDVLGAELVAYSEIDPAASKLLHHHHPGVPNLGDITAIDWREVAATLNPGRRLIVTAGYPCQPFSTAGRRQGEDDVRHLWPYVADTLGALRPSLFVGENVRGHLTLGFDQVIRDLDLLDYDVRWIILRAADVGAPHGRARLFMLGRDRGRHVRGGVAGRRGLHRDPGSGRLLPGASEGRDDRQGPAGDAGAGENVRRQAGEGPRRGSSDAGDALLASERRGCIDVSVAGTSTPAGEGRSSGHRVADAAGSRRGAASTERAARLDERDGAPSAHPAGANPGSEPSRPGSDATEAASRVSRGSSPLGGVVGAGRVPVRACRVHRAHPCVRADGGWAHLRAADSDDVGAPHGRFRVFVAAWPAADAHGDAVREQPVAVAGCSGEAVAGQPGQLGLAAADTARDGWDEGRPESARFVGGPDAAVGGDAVRDSSMRGRHVASVAGGRGEPAGAARGSGFAAADADGDGHPLVGAVGSEQELSATEGDRPVVADAGRDGRQGDEERHLRAEIGQSAPHGGDPAGRVLEWGAYEPAILRWQSILGRVAPAPTQVGARGGTQLSARFVEWLMGLPAGYVTDVPGLSRNEQLARLGNGVVPAQAAAALRHLLGISGVRAA